MKDILITKEIKAIIEELDVSDSNYEKAINRYNSVAQYIKESVLILNKPDIFLQGSFKLGTAVKPLAKDGAYDIDIVCNFTKLRRNTQTQFTLKSELGEVVKSYSEKQAMHNVPKESKRCWTLRYVDEDNFHIDILPSVPLNEKEDGYIAITDKTKSNFFDLDDDWETSNPKGYAKWFKGVSNFSIYQEEFAKRFYTSIEKVPEYKVKTPLQRIVQILKRHAEVCFDDDMEYKPSSIIITTLATKQYQSACLFYNDFFDVITYIIEHLKDGIEIRDGKPCVYNPVNNNEILSMKWEKDEKYIEAFEKWLMQLMTDFNVGNEDVPYLDKIQYVKRSLFNSDDKQPLIVNVSSISHHKKSKWKECLIKKVSINARCFRNGFRWNELRSGAAINKNWELKFEVQAKDLKDYEIWWQVTNTGKEAERANALRGDFYCSELVEGKKVRKESALYIGRHYVEAYLIKNGICYGKSLPFEVNIVDRFAYPLV